MNKLEFLESLNEIRVGIADIEDDLVWYGAYTSLTRPQYIKFKNSFAYLFDKIEKFSESVKEIESHE